MTASKKEQWTTVICPTCNHDVTTNAPETLLKKINSALARERKEAREAAFKESVAIIVGQPVEHYIYSGAQTNGSIHIQRQCGESDRGNGCNRSCQESASRCQRWGRGRRWLRYLFT